MTTEGPELLPEQEDALVAVVVKWLGILDAIEREGVETKQCTSTRRRSPGS